MATATKEPTNSTEAKVAAAKEKEAARAAAARAKEDDRAAKVAAKEAARIAKANEPKRKCLCGCGSDVNGKSNFLPGHDARLAGKVARGEADPALLAPFPALVAKAERMKAGLASKASGAEERAAAKVQRDAAKAETDAAKSAQREADRAAKAEAKAAAKVSDSSNVQPGTQDADVEVKVGRAWVPGSKVNELGGKVTVRYMDPATREWKSTAFDANKVRAIQDL